MKPKFYNILILLIFGGAAYRLFQSAYSTSLPLWTRIMYGFFGISLIGAILICIISIFEKEIVCPICGSTNWKEVPTWYPWHYCVNCRRAEFIAKGTVNNQLKSLITYDEPKDYTIYN